MELNYNINKELLTQYLANQGWIDPLSTITKVEKPGEGNMNLVIRSKLENGRSLILKQANPYVQKYPSIPAPVERIFVEAKFYQTLINFPQVQAYLPHLIGFDPIHRILAVEDLGHGVDFTFIYQKGQQLLPPLIDQAAGFLQALHHMPFEENLVQQFPNNLALRRLNHQHLFIFPLTNDNGLDLDTIQPGLNRIAQQVRGHTLLKQQMEKLGNIYLSQGTTLLHGDFYPGSWLLVQESLKVIDPEFCFFGVAEYDLAILLAHLKMAQANSEDQERIWKTYQPGTTFDHQLMYQFTGMEIIRRLIGLAQLPVDLELHEKDELLQEAVELVIPKKDRL